MRAIFFVLVLFYVPFVFSQNTLMAWAKIGVKGKVIDDLSWDAEFNSRFGQRGVETFFPQVGLTYKLKKWIKPSVEYRFIVDKNKIGNYKPSHRLNINLNFEKSWRRLNTDVRIRYQYAFNGVRSTEYNPDFDQAIRVKPNISYNLKDSPLTPEVSCEFFYDPVYGPKGPGFTKLRVAVGTKIKVSKHHGLNIKYQVDKKLKSYASGVRNVIAIAYTYKL